MIEMQEKEYSVGEVAQMLNEEVHNLRYWQKELKLTDYRNEMNQRIYTQKDINTFKFVKELRENENLSLKAIKKILNKTENIRDEAATSTEISAISNNYEEAINRLKIDIMDGIDKTIMIKNQEFKDDLQRMNQKIDNMEQQSNIKLEEILSKLTRQNQKKSFWQNIFKYKDKD